MLSQLRPSKFYVPELPRYFVFESAESSQATEAALLRFVLDISASLTGVVLVKIDLA